MRLATGFALTGLFASGMICLTAAKHSSHGGTVQAGGSGFDFEFVTVSLLQEFGKLVVSFLCLMAEVRQPTAASPGSRIQDVLERALWRVRHLRPGSAMLFGIPGLLYCVATNLQYVILRFLQPAELSLIWNFKMFATVLLLHFFLGRRYLGHQWGAMLLLVAGCALTEAPNFHLPGFGSSLATSVSNREGTSQGPGRVVDTDGTSKKLFGIVLALSGSTVVAASNVLNEWLMKNDSDPIHLQNIQLYSFGVFFNFVMLWMKAAHDPHSPIWGPQGFFTGYNNWVWTLVLLGVVSGISISAALKFVDNIVVIFAHALSVLVVTVVSSYFFGSVTPPAFLAGFTLVMVAMVIFHSEEQLVGGGAARISGFMDKALRMQQTTKPFEQLGRSLDTAFVRQPGSYGGGRGGGSPEHWGFSSGGELAVLCPRVPAGAGGSGSRRPMYCIT